MAHIDPYSQWSIQTKFKGLAELFRMSGAIEINTPNETTLLQIMTEIKQKWNNDLKTKTVEYLRGKLINHITGLKETLITNVFKDDKTLGKGQMLLLDRAERKVTFNHNISDIYTALGVDNKNQESVEYLIINPRLVPVGNNSPPKNFVKAVQKKIAGTTSNKQSVASRPHKQVSDEKESVKPIGITESDFYIVDKKNNKLPTFDEDITIFMLTGADGLPIEDTVSIGVKREPFQTGFQIGTISSHRNMIHERITKNEDITNQIKQTLQQRLEHYIPQIVKKYQTMDSLFHNNWDNVGQQLPIHQVLPNPSFPLTQRADSEVNTENLRTIRFYLLFKWMELYYDFYDFCLNHEKVESENGKQTINDPLNRCVKTLEFRMYDHQTELIKKSLLYVLYQLYDFSGVPEDKQIYTPEMLVYDLGKIIETHETSVEPRTAVNRSYLQRNTEVSQQANTQKKVAFGTAFVDKKPVKVDQKQVEYKVERPRMTTETKGNKIKGDLPEMVRTRPNPNNIPVVQQQQTRKPTQDLIKESSQSRQDQLLKNNYDDDDADENPDNDDSNSESKTIAPAPVPEIANMGSNRRNLPPINQPP